MITTNRATPHIIGAAMLLALQSPHHRGSPVGWLLDRWRQPIINKNFVYVEKSVNPDHCIPLQFACWTFVSEEWIAEISRPGSTLDYQGDDPIGGPYLFVIDWISMNIDPFNTLKVVIADIRRTTSIRGVSFIRHRDGGTRVSLIKFPRPTPGSHAWT